MKRILKYPLAIQDQQHVRLYEAARILSVELDSKGELCLWALVDERNKLEDVGVFIAGTGRPIDDAKLNFVAYRGTVLMGEFVWHVFVSRHVA